MFSKAAVISVVAGVVAAQSSSIPSGISSDCSTFLTQLNTDSSLSSCTKSLLSSGSSFNASTADASATSKALSAFCGATPSCSEDSIRSSLSSLYQKCSKELAGGANKEVTLIYDTLYAVMPYKTAMCSKGDDGNLCATAGQASSTVPLASGGSMPVQQVMDSMGTTAPNADTFAKTNMVFMFLTPSTPSASLCTSCTRNILSAYIDFESKIPYGPGFASSVLLAGQSALYSAVTTTCGANFLEGKLQAAGSLSGGVGSSPNGASEMKVLSGGAAALAVLLTLVASAL